MPAVRARPRTVGGMALGTVRIAKTFIRRAALDDLRVSLAVASWTLRLLELAAGSRAERKFAGSVARMLEEARAMLRQL